MNNFRIKFILVTIASLLLIHCMGSGLEQDKELLQLTDFMTGSFSSAEQAAADSNFFDIRLEMVRIWEDRSDAVWLYVEQAASWSLEKPYRQRVYRVSRLDDDTFESAVFSIDHPMRFAGDWAKSVPLNGVTPDSLLERSGCAILLSYEDGQYVGSTVDKQCESSLRGAAYATSQVQINQQLVTSWDRGYNAADEQVWGAITGPYQFRKQTK